MLTYKIIKKDKNIYRYIYFPYGKDIKIEGGLIEFNISDRTHKIISYAQLDEIKTIDENDYKQIHDHINQLRYEQGIDQIPYPEFKDGKYEYYKFADDLINEINYQLFENKLKEKGIVL